MEETNRGLAECGNENGNGNGERDSIEARCPKCLMLFVVEVNDAGFDEAQFRLRKAVWRHMNEPGLCLGRMPKSDGL